MVLYKNMRVETPYRLSDVEDRTIKPNHEQTNQCTYCGVRSRGHWYPIEEITVYRIWTAESVYRPDAPGKLEQGGKWQWRCSKHPKQSWAPHSHEAPPELQSLELLACEDVDRLSKQRCGNAEGTRQFEEGWFCPAHRRTYEVLADQRRLLSHEDPEAGEAGQAAG